MEDATIGGKIMNDEERLTRPLLSVYTRRMYLKKYWYLFLIAAVIFITITGFVSYKDNITTMSEFWFMFSMLSMFVPIIFMMFHHGKVASKFDKDVRAEYKRWENEPEIKEQRIKDNKNIKVFHYAGEASGGFYMLKQDVPEYNKLNKLLYEEDGLLIVQLTPEQVEQLVNNEAIELKLDAADSLTLTGKVEHSASKLYVNI